jgi:hypothetical protein
VHRWQRQRSDSAPADLAGSRLGPGTPAARPPAGSPPRQSCSSWQLAAFYPPFHPRQRIPHAHRPTHARFLCRGHLLLALLVGLRTCCPLEAVEAAAEAAPPSTTMAADAAPPSTAAAAARVAGTAAAELAPPEAEQAVQQTPGGAGGAGGASAQAHVEATPAGQGMGAGAWPAWRGMPTPATSARHEAAARLLQAAGRLAGPAVAPWLAAAYQVCSGGGEGAATPISVSGYMHRPLLLVAATCGRAPGCPGPQAVRPALPAAALAHRRQVHAELSHHGGGEDRWRREALPSLQDALRCADAARLLAAARRRLAPPRLPPSLMLMLVWRGSLHVARVPALFVRPPCARRPCPFERRSPSPLLAASAAAAWRATGRSASCAAAAREPPTSCAGCSGAGREGGRGTGCGAPAGVPAVLCLVPSHRYQAAV